MSHEIRRCALQIVGQLPDDYEAAIAVLKWTGEILKFLHNHSQVEASGGGGKYPNLTCIAKDKVSTLPKRIQSDEIPGSF